MLVRPGDPFDPDRLDRSLKTLYATGLFQDVQLSRQGNTLVVHIVENPLVSRVAFEGNHEVDDKTLTPNVQLRPARSIRRSLRRTTAAIFSISMPRRATTTPASRRRSSACRTTA